ncbi:hypothetical protein DPM13_00930 [Paracoccus mutanolyticus]|uniref:Uncharacterized protein n=2 Tax=Paracoccus mutanolyticus TaxID=1499308 RepID=A0ABM6WP93_9RHOB|nr:hypothetical protein DPM13_00930 [Paracoccus mutanolyticus]
MVIVLQRTSSSWFSKVWIGERSMLDAGLMLERLLLDGSPLPSSRIALDVTKPGVGIDTGFLPFLGRGR